MGALCPPRDRKSSVERLIKNLEERIREKSTDAEAIFNLARVHAMAYALKSDTADVRKGHFRHLGLATFRQRDVLAVLGSWLRGAGILHHGILHHLVIPFPAPLE